VRKGPGPVIPSRRGKKEKKETKKESEDEIEPVVKFGPISKDGKNAFLRFHNFSAANTK